MSFGTATATVNVQPSVDQDPAADEYVAVLDWSPIPDGPGPYPYTVAVDFASVPGNVQVSRISAPESNGNMYVRVFAKAGGVAGPLSNEVVAPYDFRPSPPTVTLV